MRTGRCWTIRLVPYGRPAAGVCVIDCSDPTCTPSPQRFRDPTLARIAALQHVREHVSRIELAEQSTCCCKAHDCVWHPAAPSAACQGRPRLVLVPDVLGRVWVIAEMCAACTRAIPRVKVLQKPVSPAPRVTPANCQLCREGAEATPYGDWENAGAAQHADLAVPRAERAMAEQERGLGPAPTGWSPPARYTTTVDLILKALADAHAGASTEARLLALVAMLRHRTDNTVRFIAEDFSADRAGLCERALEELIRGAWIHTSVAAVRAATIGAPAAVCPVPALALLWQKTGVGRHYRKPFNGWVQRLFADEMLYGQPAGVRLAALYLTAHSSVSGRGHVNRRTLAVLCRFSAPAVADSVLARLKDVGWLDTLHLNTGWDAPPSYRLAPQVRHYIPGSAPLTTRPAPASVSLTGRGTDLAAAAQTFYQRHHHAAPLRHVVTAFCPENPDAPWCTGTLRSAAQELVDEGWIEISSDIWASVRPGPAYWQALRPAPIQPSPSRPSTRHALSPRLDHPRPPRRPPSEVVPGLSPNGRGPQLPLRGTLPATSRPPGKLHDPSRPPGIYTIPGAREILDAPQRPR